MTNWKEAAWGFALAAGVSAALITLQLALACLGGR